MRRKITGIMLCSTMLIAIFTVMLPINAQQPSGFKAEIDIDPDTLNLNSRGRWITAYIEVPGYDPMDINPATIRIMEIDGVPVDIPAEPWPMEIGDGNENGVPDLMVKLSRAEVEDATGMNETVELMIIGEMRNGMPWWDNPHFDQKYRLRERFALICVSANDFYSFECNQGEYEEWKNEIWSYNQSLNESQAAQLALQDRDGFPAQGLQAYYELRDHLGYKDKNIIFMLWHDDELGNSFCERPVSNMPNFIDDDDGVDEFVSIYGPNNDLWGPDGKQGTADDPVIDYENSQVTKNSLEKAIKEDLKNLVQNARWSADVLIYLVDHGGIPNPKKPKEAAFYFEAGDSTPSKKDDYVTEKDLNKWLNKIPCYRMTVLMDSCHAGNILSTLNKSKRILVGASGDDFLAFYWMEAVTSQSNPNFAGSWFFHPFWEQISNGSTIGDAYNYSRGFIVYIIWTPNPNPPPPVIPGLVVVWFIQWPELIDRIGDAYKYKP